ncbi:MAG: iron-containing alcohol dehydrogenase [Parasporobacterium sp.]|nr:iron-containing alcohol dehydrogenase [Parasporobacterium sp.]
MRPMKLAGSQLMFGEGCLEHLKTLGCKKAIIITGGSSMKKSGIFDKVAGYLKEAGAEVDEFGGVEADPSFKTVWAGAEKMKEFQPDLIVALGGGSAIDAAKAMNYLSSREGMLKKAYFVAIPTTSGTGSEVTTFSVISAPDKKAKYPLISDELLPDAAILDAELTKTVPAAITADTGLDVLTHAYEAYVSSRSNDFTDAAAEKSMRLVHHYLLKAYKAAQKPVDELTKDDLKARQKMHHASCLAGMAFSNAGLGLNHSMAHTLGGHFHIPHGKANAVLLPYVMSYNCGCKTVAQPSLEKYAKMSNVLWLNAGTDRQNAFSTIRATRTLCTQLGIPSNLKGLGIAEKDFMDALDEMAEAAMADSCTATNPRVPTVEEIRNLFIEAYAGRVLL